MLKMKRLIQLPRFQELDPIIVMKQVFDEATEAFKDYDCEIKVINRFDDLQDGGIIFLDNARDQYINNKDLYNKIANKCPNSVFLCWYWEDLSYQPFKYMIHIGEDYYYKNDPRNNYLKYMMQPKFVPLKLRANDSPNLIGTYQRKVERDYCFMGGGYKMEWIPENFTGIYHRVIWDNYLPYAKRREIYLSSIFVLGFQSDDNIINGHLSQRLFEGLAYGCIVLCENKLASDLTNGIIVYVSSKEDLINKMNYFKSHPELIEEKQKQGYEWVKKWGTNRLSISVLLDKIKEVYNMEFDNLNSNKIKELSESKESTYLLSNMFETLVNDVKAQIEDKKLNNGNVDVKGWSFSNIQGVCPTRFKYDGTIKNADIDVRKDICEKFNKNNIILAGWHTTIPINKYVDIQMKIGSEWTSILSFNTFNMIPDVPVIPDIVKVTEYVQGVNLSQDNELQNDIVKPTDNVVDNIINNYNKQNPTKTLNRDNVEVIDFQTNTLHTSNLIVFDNFYTNPSSVHNYARLSIDDVKLNNPIKEIAAFRQHFEKILGAKLTSFDKYEYTGGFSTSIAGDKIIFDTKKYQYVALIFLQNDAPLNTGITLYRSKYTKKTTVDDSERPDVFKNSNLDSTDFEPVDIIGNVFNRLVIFNTKQIHAISNHFGSSNDNSRLVQTFAFDIENKVSNSPSTTNLSFNM